MIFGSLFPKFGGVQPAPFMSTTFVIQLTMPY